MPVAVVGAGIAAAGAVGGAYLSSQAQKGAASANANSVNQALDYSKQVYGTEANQLQPYIGTGTNALYSLSSLYGLGNGPNGQGSGATAAYNNFTQTPSYQFPLQQGELAANRGLAATGLSGSGAQAKALTQYGQGYASSNFNSYIGQLANLAGLGQQSITGLAATGVGSAAQQLQGQENIGGANAASIVGSQNSINQGVGQVIGAFGGSTNNPSQSAFGGTGSSTSPLASLWNSFNGGTNSPTPQPAIFAEPTGP